MSETKRPLTQQELDQAQRVEEMRKYREQLEAAAKNEDDEDDGDAYEDDDSDEIDGGEDEGDGEENDGEEDEPVAAVEPGKSLGELAALRPSTDEDGYAYPPVRLAALPMGQKQVVTAETETLLNGLISECGSLLRDVAFRSACLTSDAAERLRFISAAESLALTSAKVAETISHLRHGEPQVVDAHRHELIYTHVRATPPSPHSGARGDNQ